MKILILEDDLNRVAAFKKNLIGNDITFVDTAGTAIAALQTVKFDCVFLDHDLGSKVYTPSDDNSGYAVAEWLEAHPDRKPDLIYIHSLNPVGAENIKRALPEAIRVPFAWSCSLCQEFEEIK